MVRTAYHRGTFLQPLLQWKSKKSIKYSECVSVVLVIHHAMRMHRIIRSPAAYYFFILAHKRHDFRKKNNLLSIFTKILPVGIELPHADGQTEVETRTTCRS